MLFQMFDLFDEDYKQNSYNSGLKSKTVFFITHPEGSEQIMTNKLINLCQIFGVKRIEIPKSSDEFQDRLDKLNNDLNDAKKVPEI